MKNLYFLLFPFFIFGQTQIGNSINGLSTETGFGIKTAISADGMVVAATTYKYVDSGIDNFFHVYVYQNISGTWTQIGNSIDGDLSDDIATANVSLSSDGSIVAIGIPYSNSYGVDSGNTKVYQNISGVWTQIGADIVGEAPGDESGRSISLSSDGSVIAIGAPYNDGFGIDSGHVRVYKNIAGTWIQIGTDLNGSATNHRFGISVSLSSEGTILAVGAPSFNQVNIYKNISGVWTLIGNPINGINTQSAGVFNVSLSSDGNTVGVSSPYGGNSEQGEAFVYQNISGVWTQIGATLLGQVSLTNFGTSISLSSDGSILAVGTTRVGNDVGQTRIYKNISGVWLQAGADINGEEVFNLSSSGLSLSADTTTIAVGEPGFLNGGARTGRVKVYDVSFLLKTDSFVLDNFSIYPNPVSGILNINLNESLELQKINIYSSIGALLKTETTTCFKVNELATGTYFVEVITNKGKATKSFIVN